MREGESRKADRWTDLAERAARSVRVQRRLGSRASARELYLEAHSLLRTLRQHLAGARPLA